MIRSTKYPWIVVALLWVVALLNYMDRQMLSTMKPSMQVDIPELQSAANFDTSWPSSCGSTVS